MYAFYTVYREYKFSGYFTLEQAARQLYMPAAAFEHAVMLYEKGKLSDFLEYIEVYAFPHTAEEKQAWKRTHGFVHDGKKGVPN